MRQKRSKSKQKPYYWNWIMCQWKGNEHNFLTFVSRSTTAFFLSPRKDLPIKMWLSYLHKKKENCNRMCATSPPALLLWTYTYILLQTFYINMNKVLYQNQKIKISLLNLICNCFFLLLLACYSKVPNKRGGMWLGI